MTQRTCTVTTSTILQQPQFRDEAEEEKVENVRVINLKPKVKKQVKWTEDTIDNEHMDKLKSNGIIISFFIVALTSHSLLYLS